MTFLQPPSGVYPAGPYGEQFWGGYWAPVGKPVAGGIPSANGAANLQAKVQSYTAVALSWSSPADTFSGYALVRNNVGWANTLSEGSIIASGNTLLTSFTDTVTSGKTFYYTLFAQEHSATPQWVNVGTAMVTMPTDYESGADFFEKLPEWYQTLDADTPQSDINGDGGSYGQLRRFTELLGFQYDRIRTEAESLASMWSQDKVRADLLPYLSQMLGFPFDPNSGYRQVRRLLANWFEILKKKGTAEGLKLFAESVTGYDTTVGIGVNLLLGIGDSQLASTTHHGSTITGASVWQLDTTQVLGAGPSTNVSLWNITNPPAGLPAQSFVVKVFRTQANLQAAGYGETCGNPATVQTSGVPVTGGQTYTWSLYSYANNGNTSGFHLAIVWYDINGTKISTSTAGMVVANGSWTRDSLSAAAPSNAAFALPGWYVQTASTDVYTGLFQFEKAGSASTWVPAREALFTMTPQRVNYFPDPSFEGSTTHVASTSAGALCLITTPGLFGNKSLGMAMTGVVGNVANVQFDSIGPTSTITIPPFVLNDTWTFSAYVQNAQAGIGEFLALIFFKYNAAGQIIDEGVQQAFPIIFGPQSQWSQISCTTQITQANLDAGLDHMRFELEWVELPNGTSKSYSLDGVLLERNQLPGVNTYFDGSSDLTSSDYSWSGTVYDSPSMYFPNKYVRNARLTALLPDYLPVNCQSSLTYALPTT